MYPSKVLMALQWLADRPWWKRIWTVQECLLPQNCVVVYRPVEAPWSMFFEAISNLQKHRVSCCSCVPGINNTLNSLSDIMTHLRAVLTWRKDNCGVKLHKLLQIFRHRHATDQRDKVYGLLPPVTDWGNTAPVTSNYTESTTAYHVFTRTTAKLIQATRSLDVLCQHGNITIDYFSDLPAGLLIFHSQFRRLGRLITSIIRFHCITPVRGTWQMRTSSKRTSSFWTVSRWIELRLSSIP